MEIKRNHIYNDLFKNQEIGIFVMLLGNQKDIFLEN